MFSSSLRASLVVLVASAIGVSAAPSLALKTSIPNVNVDGLENLKVTATITNTGDETLKLLNDPRGVLNPFPEDTFSIANTAGSRPSFNGAKVNHAFGFLLSSVLTLSVSPPRPSSAPHTSLALVIPAFPPFSLLELLSMLFMIVSGIALITFGLCITSWNSHQ